MLTLLLAAQLLAVTANAADDTTAPPADQAPASDKAAASSSAPAVPPLDEGKTLYEQARFVLAVAKLQEAIGVLESEPDLARRRSALTDAFLHLGLAFLGLNEREAARDAFKNVLRLDPQYHPDPEIYAPKVIELFEQARLGLPVNAAGADATPASEAGGATPRPAGRLRFGFGIFAMRARYAEGDGFAQAPELGYDASSAWLAGPRGTAWGARLLTHFPNGSDRLELTFENMDGAESQDAQPGVVAPQLLTGGARGDGSLGLRLARLTTVDIRWVRRVSVSRWWELDVECGYRRLWAELDSWTYVGVGNSSVFDDSRSSDVSSHGLRFGVTGRRKLLGPLAVEMTAGYTVHAAKDSYSQSSQLGIGAKSVDETGSSTEVRGGMDIAFRADYSFRDKAALVAEYSWRHMSDYYAGKLFQAGFRLSLIIGPSR